MGGMPAKAESRAYFRDTTPLASAQIHHTQPRLPSEILTGGENTASLLLLALTGLTKQMVAMPRASVRG